MKRWPTRARPARRVLPHYRENATCACVTSHYTASHLVIEKRGASSCIARIATVHARSPGLAAGSGGQHRPGGVGA